MNTFQPGNVVRFAAPQDKEEASVKFVVIEMRGPRVLVEAQVAMTILPQHVYMADEMVAA